MTRPDTPETMNAAYALSARPYLESPCAAPWGNYINMRSWRYVLEVNSQCNLKCALCHAGNRKGYDYTPGIMDWKKFTDILDKIKGENPAAIVCAYVNSEPFLHPKLPEVIQEIRNRGLQCEIATNGNAPLNRLDEMLQAGPNLFTVSVSGFTQETYQKAHKGGKIEVVKENIRKIAEAKNRIDPNLQVGVSYHMYNDNTGEEMDKMRQFASDLGLRFITSWARAITMENTVQSLLYLESQKTGKLEPYPVEKKWPDLNKILPSPNKAFLNALERLHFHPAKAAEFYANWPVAPVCIIADVFTEIRHDGRVQLCAWTDDMRLTIGNYLEMSQVQISEARRFHPLCEHCLRFRLNLYFHIVNYPNW